MHKHVISVEKKLKGIIYRLKEVTSVGCTHAQSYLGWSTSVDQGKKRLLRAKVTLCHHR
jgi:hypothetical protein